MANKRFDADMADITVTATKVLGVKPDGTVGSVSIPVGGETLQSVMDRSASTSKPITLDGTTSPPIIFKRNGTSLFFNGGETEAFGGAETGNVLAFVYGDNSYYIATNGIRRANFNASGLAITGNITATGTITPGSDKRLKKSIKNLPTELENILSLRPVSYKLKADDAPSLGFIADEVREIYPDLIIEGKGEDKMLAMNYMGLTAPMVKAIQEMNATIQSLTKRIEELEAK